MGPRVGRRPPTAPDRSGSQRGLDPSRRQPTKSKDNTTRPACFPSRTVLHKNEEAPPNHRPEPLFRLPPDIVSSLSPRPASPRIACMVVFTSTHGESADFHSQHPQPEAAPPAAPPSRHTAIMTAEAPTGSLVTPGGISDPGLIKYASSPCLPPLGIAVRLTCAPPQHTGSSTNSKMSSPPSASTTPSICPK